MDFAKIELERDCEKTKQEEERTKQLQTMAQVVQETAMTNRQCLDILSYAVENKKTLESEEYRLGRDELREIRDEAQANCEREELLKSNESVFKTITPETERRLASQLRSSVKDLALPLRSSANDLHVSTQSNGSKSKIAWVW